VLQIFTAVFLSDQKTIDKDKAFIGDWTREMFTLYFAIIRKLLVESFKPAQLRPEPDRDFTLDSTAADLKSALELFSNTLSEVHKRIPYASLNDRVLNQLSESVINFLEQHLSLVKQNVIKDFEAAYKYNYKKAKLPEEGPKQICEKMAKRFLDDIDLTLQQFKLFIDTKDSNLGTKLHIFKSLAKAHTSSLFETMIGIVEQQSALKKFHIYESDKKTELVSPSGALILCKFCMLLKRQVVIPVESMLDDRFPVANPSSSRRTVIKEFEADKINHMLTEVSKSLVLYYIETQGQDLSKLVATGIRTPDWLNVGVPHTVRAMITTIVADVALMNSELGDLFKDSSKNDDSDNSSSHSGYPKGSSSAGNAGMSDGYNAHSMIAMNVMKIFDKKLGTFVIRAPEKFTRASIMTEILKLTIKTFGECVRLCTFGKHGFQQMQLETHYLSTVWSAYSDDEKYVFRVVARFHSIIIYTFCFIYHFYSYISSLLQEVMYSTAERCIEPVPLEQNIVESLCQKSLDKK